LTSGMIEVAGQFLEAVKAKDVAQARTWLSSEAQAATDENALRQFLVNLEVLGFGTANWPVRQILGQRGELKGTITNAFGEVPMVLTFVKEDGQWRILHLSRPATAPKGHEMQALRSRADSGDANAQSELAEKYLAGHGVEKSAVEAEKWFRKAAEQGSATAQHNLAAMYDEGQGVPTDKAEARKWYLKAAQQGFANAQFALGYNYAHGDGVEKDYAEALIWYRKAADQSFASAQLSLGTLYLNGFGVPKDDAQAVAWFQKAAAQGVAQGQLAMGDAYALGRGIQQDEKAAVEWYQRAADQGLPSAQNRLATTYSEGKGVPKSDKEAYYWRLLGARNDDKKRDQLYEARRPLTPDEISEVEARASKWQPKSARTAN